MEKMNTYQDAPFLNTGCGDNLAPEESSPPLLENGLTRLSLAERLPLSAKKYDDDFDEGDDETDWDEDDEDDEEEDDEEFYDEDDDEEEYEDDEDDEDEEDDEDDEDDWNEPDMDDEDNEEDE